MDIYANIKMEHLIANKLIAYKRIPYTKPSKIYFRHTKVFMFIQTFIYQNWFYIHSSCSL